MLRELTDTRLSRLLCHVASLYPSHMYSVSGYGQMIADEPRMAAYSEALRRAVTHGCVVLDIGAGTGIASFLACQLGARKVYAVEPSDSIGVAEQIARANGFADRIQFFQGLSTRMELPEPADVIVSDLRGALPLFGHHIPSLQDARARLLKPGGTLIPKRDTLWAAPVEAPETYGRIADPWEGHYGLDMSAAKDIVTNAWTKARLRPEQLLSEPQSWAAIDYSSVESPSVSGEVSFRAARAGACHGLLVWFDAELIDGVGFSNAPGQPELVYGSGFFPWPSPVQFEAGDSISIRLRADLVGDDYIWGWDSEIRSGESANTKAQFQQSTFFSAPLAMAQLKRRGSTHRATLGEDGRIDALILQLMDGNRTNEEIAKALYEQFPKCFSSHRNALTRVADLAQKYER
jgi:type I protein arginine methyltransferase